MTQYSTPTSLGRASALNRFTVKEFFNNSAKVLNEYRFTAQQIFNVDETGLTTVQNLGKIVTARGVRNVGSVTSAERGKLVTAVYTICVSGSVLPPLLIFSRVHYRDHFVRGGHEDCIGQCSKSGWINEDLFLVYLEDLISRNRCSLDHKILLILDNHESHISLRVIDKAKSSGIVMLAIPPKTSHRLQSLDVSVFGPFKRGYNKAMDNWMRIYPGKTLTICEVSALVKEAQLCALMPRNILSGFKNTGTWSYNPDIFAEEDFAATTITDRPAPDIQITLINDLPVDSARSSACTSQSMLIGGGLNSHTMQAGSSVDDATLSRAEKTTSPEHFAAPSSTVYVSPSGVYSIPKAQPRISESSARKGKKQILTSTQVREKYALLKKQKIWQK